MSPTVKAIAYGVVSLLAFIIAAACACRVLLSNATGSHASDSAPSDKHAPTLGDALAWWLNERACDAWSYLLVLAGDVAHWRPVRELRIRWNLLGWRLLGLRPGNLKLRVPAAASAPGEGAVPGTSAPGAVPLEVRVTAADGFPAVAFRPGKQPWETAGQPRLPEMRP